MAKFIGSFTHTIDSQRRVAIPKQWRESLEPPVDFYLVPGYEKRIHVIPGDLFQRVWMPKLEQVSIGNAELSRSIEVIARQTHYCVCDRQGRINLTPELMKFAGLGETVVLNGAFTEFRLVSPDGDGADSEPFGDALKHLQRLQEGVR